MPLPYKKFIERIARMARKTDSKPPARAMASTPYSTGVRETMIKTDENGPFKYIQSSWHLLDLVKDGTRIGTFKYEYAHPESHFDAGQWIDNRIGLAHFGVPSEFIGRMIDTLPAKSVHCYIINGLTLFKEARTPTRVYEVVHEALLQLKKPAAVAFIIDSYDFRERALVRFYKELGFKVFESHNFGNIGIQVFK